MKKSGFFKKLLDSSKTVAASARSSIAVSQSGSTPSSPQKQRLNNGVTSIAGGMAVNHNGRDAAKEMGLGGGNLDWVNVRRDVNRSNTPGPMERQERAERCQMLDHPVIYPIDELYESVEGEEEPTATQLRTHSRSTTQASLASTKPRDSSHLSPDDHSRLPSTRLCLSTPSKRRSSSPRHIHLGKRASSVGRRLRRRD